MDRFGVALIGVGPRGLAIFERLSALIDPTIDGPCFDVHVVDPGHPGQGVHRDDQPDHLLTNTAAGSTTAFVDESVENAGPPRPGPNLHQWLLQDGYRCEDGRIVRSTHGAPIAPSSFVPRALLGRYLGWAYGEFVRRMPANVAIHHHPCRAVSIAKRPDDRFDIRLGDGTRLDVEFVFLSTGHGDCGPRPEEAVLQRRVASLRHRNPNLAFRRLIDPIESLAEIAPEAKVAICGMGLTAIDAVSMFTHGRGGVFERVCERRLRYHPSGKEPCLFLFSRNGLPPISKPIDRRGAGRAYVPRFFTRRFIERSKRLKGKLDWATDLQPCLEKELMLRLARHDRGGEPDSSIFDPLPSHVEALDAFLHPWRTVSIADADAYRAFIRRYLENDIDASFVGNIDHPFKAIVEILRDLNDVVRLAVDYGGLTPESHRSFLGDWCSIAHRIAAGPPKERAMELLALIEAGILHLHEPGATVDLDERAARFRLSSTAFGYTHETQIDVLIQARVGRQQPGLTSDPLLRSGLDEGLFTAFDNDGFSPGGLAIDGNLNVVGADGRAEPNIWATGYVVEGAHYYTHVLACPNANSRSLRDAGRAVFAMLGRAGCKTRRMQGAGGDETASPSRDELVGTAN